MDEKEKDRKDEWPDDNKVIYIPDAEYHAFMQSFRKMEMVQQELHKIKDGMKPEDRSSKGNDKQSL